MAMKLIRPNGRVLRQSTVAETVCVCVQVPQGGLQTYPFVVDAGKENFSRATAAAIPPSWQETFVSLF